MKAMKISENHSTKEENENNFQDNSRTVRSNKKYSSRGKTETRS